MKRVPSVGWAFFGLAVVIYVVYLLNRGVYVGSTVGLNMAPIDVMSLEKGRQLTGAEAMALPSRQLTDAQVIALAEAPGGRAAAVGCYVNDAEITMRGVLVVLLMMSLSAAASAQECVITADKLIGMIGNDGSCHGLEKDFAQKYLHLGQSQCAPASLHAVI